jgi:hypothetical protein
MRSVENKWKIGYAMFMLFREIFLWTEVERRVHERNEFEWKREKNRRKNIEKAKLNEIILHNSKLCGQNMRKITNMRMTRKWFKSCSTSKNYNEHVPLFKLLKYYMWLKRMFVWRSLWFEFLSDEQHEILANKHSFLIKWKTHKCLFVQ